MMTDPREGLVQAAHALVDDVSAFDMDDAPSEHVARLVGLLRRLGAADVGVIVAEDGHLVTRLEPVLFGATAALHWLVVQLAAERLCDKAEVIYELREYLDTMR